MKKILEEFKAFALKGNMIDMAVAVSPERLTSATCSLP